MLLDWAGAGEALAPNCEPALTRHHDPGQNTPPRRNARSFHGLRFGREPDFGGRLFLINGIGGFGFRRSRIENECGYWAAGRMNRLRIGERCGTGKTAGTGRN